ncbi:MAG: HD-GYP domain-containing protein [bacterium]|nr:HD-GYP domain-containing protein [bacterium]
MVEDELWQVKRIKYKWQKKDNIFFKQKKKKRCPVKIIKKDIAKKIEEIPKAINKEIKNEAINVICQTVEDVKYGKIVNSKETKKIIRNMIKEITENRDAMLELERIKEYDDYTFVHSLNVCILSMLIGMELKIDRKNLEELALGALLHDIGKTLILNSILNKEEQLASIEFEEIKKHPLYSYQIISQDRYIGEIPKTIAYQHQERYNGSGYPQGLRGSEINNYAVIASLADVYDALITDRVYRRALLPYEAMKIIIGSSGIDFNPDIAGSFVKSMSIYPPGSLVRLNTGEIAIVVRVSKESIIRPIIRVILGPSGATCKETIEIDLTKEDKHYIIGAVDIDVLNR